jgi:hypothetical protein
VTRQPLGWSLPVDLSRHDLGEMGFCSCAVFNREKITAQDCSDPMRGIAMPKAWSHHKQDGDDEPECFRDEQRYCRSR